MANPSTQVFDFVFTEGGHIDNIDVTASNTLTPVTNGDGQVGYATTNITGNIYKGNKDLNITGQYGTGGNLTQNNFAVFDNTIFTSDSQGVPFGGASGSTAGIDNPGLEFKVAGGNDFNLYSQNGQFFLFDSSNPAIMYNLTLVSPCFCAGTLIETDRGPVAIEEMAIGDKVVTSDGRTEPVQWIGTRAVAPRFMDPLKVMPIRIKAGALGEGVPARDLLLSPDHAVLVDGILAQAGALVNGASIVREETAPESFTYYHIELADHSLILAEGAAAETFVDNVDRMGFDNWAEHEALFGTDLIIVEMEHPRAKSQRQVPQSTRNRLMARAIDVAGALAA